MQQCSSCNSLIFYITDIRFVPDGTSKLRENSENFGYNFDLKEIDGVYRDGIVTSIPYNGKNILHFGDYQSGHMWVVIKIGDDWYDTEPTGYDITRMNYVPQKITF